MPTQIRRENDNRSGQPGMVELDMALFQWPWRKADAPKAEPQAETLDPLDDQVWADWIDRQLDEGVERVRATRRRMRESGILDEKGELVDKELPPEMLAGDKPCDVA